jgi:capsular polysaccharide transport system permease protein
LKKVLQSLNPSIMRLAVIVVPWLATAIYLFVFAADRYVAESVVAVRQEGAAMSLPSGVDTLSAMFGSTMATREDQYMLEAHILSMDMLLQIDEKVDLREAFSAPKLDVIFALPDGASQEKFLKYFRSHVDVTVDDSSGLLTIRTQGFTPEVALAVNQQIVDISEKFINESSHRLARDQMAYAEAELRNARARLDETRNRILEFQEKYGILDPTAQAAANSGLTAELQAMLARQGAELKGLQAYLNDDAPQIQALQAQIAGIREQLEDEMRGSVTNVDGTSLNVIAGEYQELLADLEFKSDAYKGALTGLETARIESTRKLKSLVLVESPVLPESAAYPRRLYTLIALAMVLTLLYGIVRLIVATIEDHME